MDYITWMWWALSQSFSYTAAYYCRCIMLKMWNPLKNQNLNELAFMKCRSLGSWNSMQQEIVRWKFCPSIWTNRSMNASSKNYNKLCYQRNVTMAKKKTFPSSIASDGLTVSGLHHSRTETSLLTELLSLSTLIAQWQMNWTKVQEIPKSTNELSKFLTWISV